MTSADKFPDLHEILPEHAIDFCTNILDLLNDGYENYQDSFIGTIETLVPAEITLGGTTLVTHTLPQTVREKLTQAPLTEQGDELFASLTYKSLPDGEIELDRLELQHNDSANKVVLVNTNNSVITILDYSAIGHDRKTLAPQTMLEDTLLCALFDRVPDDLSNEKWQQIVYYFEQKTPETERVFTLHKAIDGYDVIVRIIEKEIADDSVHALEISILEESESSKLTGWRFSITELGTTAKIIANSNTVRALRTTDETFLNYDAVFEAIKPDNTITPHIPSEDEIALFEDLLIRIVGEYRKDASVG